MIPTQCTSCGQFINEKRLSCPACGTFVEPSGEHDAMECEHHPGERAIGMCVVCGKPVCGDCAVRVQEITYCDQPEHQSTAQECTVIHTSDSEFAADAVQRNLEFAGIQTKVFSMRDHLALFWFDESAIVRVMVLRSDVQKAIAVLKELQLLNEQTDAP